MKDLNKRFSAYRITEPEGIVNRCIKKASHNLSNNSLNILFDDNTFFVVHIEYGDLYFNIPLNDYEYRKIGLITDKEYDEYVKSEKQSQKDSSIALELKELKRLKEKYEGKNNEYAK